MTVLTRRCGLCLARGIEETDRFLRFGSREKRFAYACTDCGMLYVQSDSRFDGGRIADGEHISCSADNDVGFDIYTLRMLAARFGYAIQPCDAEQENALGKPHSDLPGKALALSLAHVTPAPLTLGVMCRENEVSSVLEKIAPVSDQFVECIIVADRSPDWDGQPALPANVRLFGRHLERRFNAQRNFIQQLSRTDWVLQLDADEQLDAASIDRLRRLAKSAGEQGVVSIGIPRQNYVDGVLSDVYPDVQYRLNRSSVRYEGVVHERPRRPWQNSMIAVGTNMVHTLRSEHVGRRSQLYDAISPGNGRLDEQETLVQPFKSD